MMNLFKKLFKKQSEPSINHFPTKSKPSGDWIINGKRYVSDDTIICKVQTQSDDVEIYGWTLQSRYELLSHGWTQWTSESNNRIYQSRSSAIDAAIKIFKNKSDRYEWRISPLYVMSQPQFRDYKIDRLLSEDNPKKADEMKTWRVIEDKTITNQHGYKTSYKKDDIYIQIGDSIIKSATCKDRHYHCWGNEYLILKKDMTQICEEIDIKNEKWIYPHLTKELKLKLKGN